MDTLRRTYPDVLPSSWSTAGIADARALRVGSSPTIHRPKHFTPRRVVAKCGVVGFACEVRPTERAATWADGDYDCERCR